MRFRRYAADAARDTLTIHQGHALDLHSPLSALAVGIRVHPLLDDRPVRPSTSVT